MVLYLMKKILQYLMDRDLVSKELKPERFSTFNYITGKKLRRGIASAEFFGSKIICKPKLL